MKSYANLLMLVVVAVIVWLVVQRDKQGTLDAQATEQRPEFGVGNGFFAPGYNFDWFSRNTWNGDPFSIGGGWSGWNGDGVPAAPKPLENPGFGVGSAAGGSDLLNGDPFGGGLLK